MRAGLVRQTGGQARPLCPLLLRCLVLVGGAIAAWLLCGGIASAAAASGDGGSAAAASGGGGPADTPSTGSQTRQLSAAEATAVADRFTSGLAAITAAPLSALADATPVLPVAAPAPAAELMDRLHPAAPLPAVPLPSVLLPSVDLRLPGAGLPALPEVPLATGVRPPAAREPQGAAPPNTSPEGDRPALGSVTGTPAVAAGTSPRPATRAITPTALAETGVPLVPAATPGHEARPGQLPQLPASPCPPLPGPPAMPVAGAVTGQVAGVEVTATSRQLTGWPVLAAPDGGSTGTLSIAEQPGTTPD